MRPVVSLFLLLAAAGCTGCPPPPKSTPVTIVASDGSVVEASVSTVCANVHNVCGTDEDACNTHLKDIVANTPVDLPCGSTKTTKADLHNCPGIGTDCPL